MQTMSNDEQDITSISGVGPKRADALRAEGFETVGDVLAADISEVAAADGIGEQRAENIQESASGNPDANVEGQPSKLDDAADDLIEAAESGMSLEGCARSAGISSRTLLNWRTRGEEADDPSDPYFQFFRRFAQARARGERELVESVSENDPEFILKTSFGYTEKQEVEHSGQIDGEQKHTHEVESELSEQQLEHLEQLTQ